MSFTVPRFVPLTKGLDLSKESLLGSDDLVEATNLDYSVDGSVRGRPARANYKNALMRDVGLPSAPTYIEESFYNLGRRARGLITVRDTTGERPAVVTDGRLFVEGDDFWYDKGPVATARVDRVVNFRNDGDGTFQPPVAMDFALGPEAWQLLGDNFDSERTVQCVENVDEAISDGGTAARCGTTTAIVRANAANELQFWYRTSGDDTINHVTLDTDARVPLGTGDAPCICCSHDATRFYIAYFTTGIDQFKVIAVSITGTIEATYFCGVDFPDQVTNLRGIWVDNSPVFDDVLVVALTRSDNVVFRTLAATSMTNTNTDTTVDPDPLGHYDDVVVGIASGTKAWWCVKSVVSGGPDYTALHIGSVIPGAAGSWVLHRSCWGGEDTRTAGITWGIVHQPVTLRDRTYLTVVAAQAATKTGTWLTLDLTDWVVPTSLTGSYENPTLVARGPAQATVPLVQPGSATLLPDGTGWVFPTLDWEQFTQNIEGEFLGHEASVGLNRVLLSGPRAVQAGQSTIISGSVPHVIQRGQCAELGFPFMAGVPGCAAEPAIHVGVGGLAAGDYGVVGVWRWVDEAGQMHRSAPSVIRTVTIPNVTDSVIKARVTNPWFTEKAYGSIMLEVYCTDVDPTPDSIHYLVAVAEPDFTDAFTIIEVSDLTPVLDEAGEPLYSDGELQNVHVPGDGGVACVGRRVWMAGASTVYASKLLVPGTGVGFNDAGQLQVDLPAGAGRVLALENLDERLIILCARGVYMVQDGGPANNGVGSDFASPVELSRLGIAGPRSSVKTDQGILFCVPFNEDDPAAGGPWLLDKQLTLTARNFLGRGLLDYLAHDGFVADVAYLPERQQAFFTLPNLGNGSAIAMLDMRVGKWSVWPWEDSLYADGAGLLAASNQCLWAMAVFGNPHPYSEAPGTVETGYSMTVRTAHLPVDGRDGLGWGRVRNVIPLQGKGSGTHSLQMEAVMDYTRTVPASPTAVNQPGTDTTWPTSRQAVEWRLVEKGSTIQVALTATPATARWAAIRLDLAPIDATAPSKTRI